MSATMKCGGQELAYEEHPGEGPVFLLVHGVASDRGTWDRLVPLMIAGGRHVVTVDLPGHGESGEGRGDYSLGAFASALRDLLDDRDISRAILVGHSLGGGVALQLAYQFPERCAGLVLVAGGGLGREASPLLRAATLPGAELVLPVLTQDRVLAGLTGVGRALSWLPGAAPASAVDDAVASLRGLQDRRARRSFLATLRSVVDISGQRVSAVDGLGSLDGTPTLLVWGDRDPVLPLAHGTAAAELIPGARLVVFPGCGHEPHRHDPVRLAELLVAHADPATRGGAPGTATAVLR